MKLLTIFNKEWRLLWRDKIGLIFLFILPMCLVLFITLTSSVEPTKPRQLNLLLINQDNGAVSSALIKALEKVDDFVIKQKLKRKPLTLKNAQKAVGAGDYQALIFIPAQLSQQALTNIQQTIQPRVSQSNSSPEIKIFFDPDLPKNFQDQITAGIQLLTQTIEFQLLQNAVSQMTNRMNYPPNTAKPAIINVSTTTVQTGESQLSIQANAVQQNVPAWTLFGMFFIITPLSGMIIKERKLGVMDRLWLAPVSLLTLIWGKIIAFVCVNILQLVLMLAVGVFILPMLGFPTLDVTSHPFAILMVGLAASFAATGFGLLIGSLVQTSEQATVIGPFVIVIMASIGGIFVPTYLLPTGLKQISEYSPMNWALQGFIDIFVRNANLSLLLPNIAKLLGFALVTIILASVIISRHRQ